MFLHRWRRSCGCLRHNCHEGVRCAIRTVPISYSRLVKTVGLCDTLEIAAFAHLCHFLKNDYSAPSQLLTRLVTESSEVSRIEVRGQHVALREFSFDRMMERWTNTLRQLHENKVAPHVSRSGDGTHHRTERHGTRPGRLFSDRERRV